MRYSELVEAKTYSGPKPPWYERSINQLPKYLPYLKNGSSPFPLTTVQIQETLPRTVGDWCGSWSVDPTGQITILLQTSFYDQCIKAGLEWELIHTLQHEYMEAKISINDARTKHPGMNPYVMAEKDESIGGEAHYKTIRELDGISDVEYDTWLSKISKYLKAT